jgi:hypothetical protein
MTAMRAVSVAATQTAANIAAAAGHQMPDQHGEARGHRDDIDDVESVHDLTRRRCTTFFATFQSPTVMTASVNHTARASRIKGIARLTA